MSAQESSNLLAPRLSQSSLMPITALLRFTLRNLPPFQEGPKIVQFALRQVPKGVPEGMTLGDTTIHVRCRKKQWNSAMKKTDAILAEQEVPVWIVEAHVAANRNTLEAIVMSIQVVQAGGSTRPTQGGPSVIQEETTHE